MKDKIPFEEVNDHLLQDLAADLVKNHVYSCQSYLVSELFSKDLIQYDDYQNLYLSDEKIKEYHSVDTEEEIQEIRDHGSDMQEVFEHWLCSDWLIHKLKEQEEPILETDLETWWGRTCTGQAIALDYNIQKLAYENSYDERLFKQLETA